MTEQEELTQRKEFFPESFPERGASFNEELPDFNKEPEYFRKSNKSEPGYVCFDIETGENPRSELFKPEFKQLPI